MTINAVSYGEFSLGLHRYFGDRRVPVEVLFEMTCCCFFEC